ncbi:hypothetical protein GCM10010315_53350 [Streptomyces luteosporeus]|uniref:Uncharacterized protein n=1 Tax=Streptomyces luteosporeus TaxID=173856 RepID=A0ABN3U4M4_9ACTN
MQAHDLVAVVADRVVDDGPQDGVEAGAVAAGGEHTDAHDRVTSHRAGLARPARRRARSPPPYGLSGGSSGNAAP